MYNTTRKSDAVQRDRTRKGALCVKRLLIRADDLGYSQGVNCGIAATVAAGLVRSVGVMTNMPDAVHGLGLLAGHPVCLGQHTNICVGRPLTNPARIPSLCTPEGEFKPSRAYRDAAKAGKDFVVLEEVVEEIEAQYRQFKALTGKDPGYFEGHAVASPNFFKGLEMVAARHNLPYFAMGCPGQAVTFRSTKIYAYMPKDFAAYEADPFTGVQDAVANAHEGGCDLMVFHPGYLDAYLLDHSTMTTARVREVEMLCRPHVRAWLAEQPVQLVTYDDLT